MRAICLLPLALLAACNPPAADRYVARVGVEERAAPLPPIGSPDTEGAIWAPSAANPMRLVYGKPGERPLFALACGGKTGAPALTYTRFAMADARAKGILALIGNGHVARLKIDATRTGQSWLWQGTAPAADEAFEALTGARHVEATVPGAGSLILNPSPLPGELILRCRALAPPAAPESAPAEAGVLPLPPPGTTDTAALPPPPAR